MSAIRIVPRDDDSAFPYERALGELRTLGVALVPKDFTAMLNAGRRMGWSEAMIRANEELAERGKCYDFQQTGPPHLRGSLFENNIYFSFESGEHQEACLPLIHTLAETLGAQIWGT